jgi:RES domain-containing protein
VPSALVPQESNYVVNRLHPDAARIRVSRPEPVA